MVVPPWADYRYTLRYGLRNIAISCFRNTWIQIQRVTIVHLFAGHSGIDINEVGFLRHVVIHSP